MNNQRNAVLQWFAVFVLCGAALSAYIGTRPGERSDRTLALAPAAPAVHIGMSADELVGARG